MAQEFFEKLPKQLSQAEVDLKNLLRKTADLAQKVLRGGQVSLQEWAEERIPGEVFLEVNAGGIVLLPSGNAAASASNAGNGARTQPFLPQAKARSKGGGSMPPPVAPVAKAKAGHTTPKKKVNTKAFFDSL